MKPRNRFLIACGVVSLLAAACGGDDDDGATPSDDGVVAITMNDNTFEPDRIEVEAGQTVTFEFRNEGEVQHEAFIGTEAEQEAHEAEMDTESQDADSGHGEDETTDETTTTEDHMAEDTTSEGMASEALTVAPGESGTLEYTFNEAGTIIIGCHEPGHYEDGMTLAVEVQ